MSLPPLALLDPLTEQSSEHQSRLESEVRLYSRCFPATYTYAKGARVNTADGRGFIDFFCAAGSVNYGHNPDHIKHALMEYLAKDGLIQGLDLDTPARAHLLQKIDEVLLRPRELEYKLQFCGPTGTDAIEAASMLARKATGKKGIVAFAGSFHGMSAGSLSLSGKVGLCEGAARVSGVTFIPYDTGPQGPFDSITYLDRMLGDSHSGVEFPAAVILEPVQIESGVYPASLEWLRALRAVTERHGVLLICDEIQSGCGRTGSFFAFERAGIVPDVVALAKSLGGYGLPLAMIMFRPELDAWGPGEFTGTFRGSQLGLIAASAALDFWRDAAFVASVNENIDRLARFASDVSNNYPRLMVRGTGMLLGIDHGVRGSAPAKAVQDACFSNGLLVERCGRTNEVIKVMPPLNIEEGELERGLSILMTALAAGDDRD